MNMATKKLQIGGLKKMSAVVNTAIDPARGADADIALDLIDLQRQVRTKMQGLEEFAANLKIQGVKTPIILHVEQNGRYRLIAGERRYRASMIAGLSTIPARLERNLSEREIRAIQVSENNERENLTAYEQAMGVIEDVDNYGVKEAMEIWNRSESWISKRVAVRKYDTRITKLMADEISDDLEMLQTLNHIIILKPDDFYLLETRLREGQGVTREETRSKLAGIKSWLAEQEQMANRRKQVTQKSKDAHQVDQTADENDDTVDTPKAKPTAAKQVATKAASKSGEGAVESAPTRQQDEQMRQETGQGDTTADIEKKRRAFQDRLAAVFDIGTAGRTLFDALQTDLIELDCTKDQTDWVLWSEFLTIALPLLAACGPERSVTMLKRLQADLRQKGVAEQWKTMYPDANDRIAIMPANWRL